jgi:hypothetical protein
VALTGYKFISVVLIIWLALSWQNALAQNDSPSHPILIVNQHKFSPGDTVWIKIYLFKPNGTPEVGKHWIQVNVVDNEGTSNAQSVILMQEGIGSGQLSLPETMPAGYHLITAYDAEAGENSSIIAQQRIAIVSEETPIALDSSVRFIGESASADIKLEKKIFRPREKVTIQVVLTDKDLPVAGEFSISIANTDLISVNQNGVALAGFFKNDRTESNPSIKRSPNRYKEGRVVLTETGQSLPDSTKLFVYLQKSGWRYQTIVGKNGYVKLPLPDQFIRDEFFYLAEIEGKILSAITIQWKEKTIKLPSAVGTLKAGGIDQYGLYASKKRFIDQSFKFYSGSSNSAEATTKPHYEFIPVTVNINTGDYDPFPTMAEYIKEVVPSIFLRKRNGERVLRVKLGSLAPSQPVIAPIDDPIYIIDGTATCNTEFFLSLKPSDIKSIRIATDPRKLVPYGLFGKNGIVIIQSKKGNVREPLQDRSRIFPAVNKPVPFHLTMHEQGDDLRLPDFRAALYWNSSFFIDQSGNASFEIYCSDDEGKFRVEVVGFTSTGKPFLNYLIFDVKAE